MASNNQLAEKDSRVRIVTARLNVIDGLPSSRDLVLIRLDRWQREEKSRLVFYEVEEEVKVFKININNKKKPRRKAA